MRNRPYAYLGLNSSEVYMWTLMSTFDEFIEAVKSQDYEVVQTGLRNENISVSAHDKTKKCALEHAIELGDMKLIVLLVESGRFKVNKHTCKYTVVSTTPIKYAAVMGFIEAVKYMLKDQNDVDMQELYFMAAQGGSTKMVKWIIDAGLVDPNVRNLFGANVLILAGKHEDMAEYLLDNKLVDQNNICQNNLGHVAAMYGQVKLLKRYLDEGGDIEAIDGEGKTPLLSALEQSQLECIKLLVERGAQIDIDNGKLHCLLDSLDRADEGFIKALNLEANRSMIRPKSFSLIANSFKLSNYSHIQERFIKYFLPILPKNLIEEVAQKMILFSISTGQFEFLEVPFKLAMSQDTSRKFKERLIANSIYAASSYESLAMLREVFRLSDEAFMPAETMKELFRDCLSMAVSTLKADFMEFWMKEKEVPLRECPPVKISRPWMIDHMEKVGYEFSDELEEDVAEARKLVSDRIEAERAKDFNPDSVDSQLNGLEGEELAKKVREVLLELIEKQLYFGVLHVLNKWKPSTRASDYPTRYPVNAAATVAHYEIVRALCEYGFSVNVYDAAKTEAMVEALKLDDTDLALYIILRGMLLAYPLKSEERFPIFYVAIKFKNEQLAVAMAEMEYCPMSYGSVKNSNLLHLALSVNMPNLAGLALSKNPKCIFERDDSGELPSHLAFLYGCFEALRPGFQGHCLIAPAVCNDDGETPLELAISAKK